MKSLCLYALLGSCALALACSADKGNGLLDGSGGTANGGSGGSGAGTAGGSLGSGASGGSAGTSNGGSASGASGGTPNGGSGAEAGSSGEESGGSSSTGGDGNGSGGDETGEGGSSVGGGGGAGGDEPITVTLTALEDAYVDSENVGTNYGSNVALLVDGGPEYQTFIKPTSLGSIPEGATIQSATLTLVAYNEGQLVTASLVTEVWEESVVNWNLRPSLGEQLDTFTPAVGVVEVDVTAAVQAWADGADIHGIALTESETNGSDYHSTEAATEGNRPVISVTYLP
jgi:hypothetical protein